MSHLVSKTLQGSTAVTHSVSGRFTSSSAAQQQAVVAGSANELLVIKSNVLTLYHVDLAAAGGKQGGKPLHVIHEQTLAAPVMAAEKIPRSGGDLVVLCVSESHLSILQYDNAAFKFVPYSLHHMGEAAIPSEASPLPPILRVDMQSGMIAFLVRRRYLFLIPFGSKVNKLGETSSTTAGGADSVKGGRDESDDDAWGDEEDDKAPGPTDDISNPTTTAAGALELGQHRYMDLQEEVPVNPLRFIRDMVFMPTGGTSGSSECDLLFLRGKDSVWAGRVKLRENNTTVTQTLSCTADAVHFSFKSNYEPQAIVTATGNPDSGIEFRPGIWKAEGLPFNASKLIVLDPSSSGLGGFLCLCTNSLIHLTLKGSSTGFYINRHGEEECSSERSQTILWRDGRNWAAGSKKTLASINFSFESSLCCPVGPKRLMFSNADTGDMCLVSVQGDDRGLTAIELAIKGRSNPPSCISSLVSGGGGDGTSSTIFVGSSVGDSVCLRLSSPDLKLQVLDTLLNVGPIVDATLVDSQAVDAQLSEENIAKVQYEQNYGVGGAANPSKPNPFIQSTESVDQGAAAAKTLAPTLLDQYNGMELLTACGMGKAGRLCIQTRGVRFRTFLEQNLKCMNCFVLQTHSASDLKRSREEEDDGGAAAPSNTSQAFLLASNLDSTMVIEVTANSLQPVNKMFFQKQRTIFATVVQKEICLQVLEHGLVVGHTALKPAQQIEFKHTISAFTEDEKVIRANYCYKTKTLALLTSASQLLLLCPSTNSGDMVTFDLKSVQTISDADAFTFDQEFGHLYVSRSEDYSLEIYNLAPPKLTLIQKVSGFSCLPESVDGDGMIRTLKGTGPPSTKKSGKGAPGKIQELLVAPVGPTVSDAASMVCGHETRLFILTASKELAVYRFQRRNPQKGGSPSALVKEQHSVHDFSRRPDGGGPSSTAGNNNETAEPQPTATLIPFDKLGEHRGVYICGKNPKICLAHRGGLKLLDHSLPALKSVTASSAVGIRHFAPLLHPAMGHGAVVSAENQVLFVNLAHPGAKLETDWPARVLNLGQTPHFVSYSPCTCSCLVAVAEPKPFRPIKAPFDIEISLNKEGLLGAATGAAQKRNDLLEPVKADEGIPIPTQDRFTIRLYNAQEWKQLDSLPLEENEVVLAMKQVDILSPDAYAAFSKKGATAPAWGFPPEDLREVIVIGTGFPVGEDVPCRGRVLLLGVRTDFTTKQRLIQLLHASDTKGPVTAVTGGLSGQIATTVGATVHLSGFDWQLGRLVTKAIYFGSTYITSITTLKNYLLVTDLYNSVSLVRYRHDNHTLTTIGKDPHHAEVHAAEFIFNGRDVGILSADENRNAILFNYEVKVNADRDTIVESNLKAQAETRLTSNITKLIRVRLPKELRRGELQDKSVVFYTTQSGELGVFQPISETGHRTLDRLTAIKIPPVVPQPAGLHPIFFKAAERKNENLVGANTKAVDGDLCLSSFVTQSSWDRAEIVGRGAQPDTLLGTLAALGDDVKFF